MSGPAPAASRATGAGLQQKRKAEEQKGSIFFLHGAAAHHEDVARHGAFAAIAEKFQQVVKLPMNVATDRDRALHRLHSALLEHQLLHVLAKMLEVVLRQQFTFSHGSDPCVQVSSHCC